MLQFGESHMFWLLLLLPAMAGLYWLGMRARGRRLRRFGNPDTLRGLMPDASPRRGAVKFILFACAVALIVVALARPRMGAKLRERSGAGIELMLALDVSNSMLAGDFEPNRLELMKRAIMRLLSELKEDRVGLVVFAGTPYVQLPITSDYVTARSMVSRVSPGMVARQGTAIGSAIETAANSFSSGSEGSRVIVVVSDGENHEDDALASAKAANERGITIYTIGIGSPEGAPISVGGDYLRDSDGEMVVSRLDEQTLQQIALTTGGSYLRATRQNPGLDEIVAKIRETTRRQLRSASFDQYDELFAYPLSLALILLLLEMLMLDRKNPLLARFRIFGKEE